jgi:hypothetical protein
MPEAPKPKVVEKVAVLDPKVETSRLLPEM